MKTEKIKKLIGLLGEVWATLDDGFNVSLVADLRVAREEAQAELTTIETALTAKDDALRKVLAEVRSEDGMVTNFLFKEIEAALSPPTGKVLVDRELLDDAISLGQLLMWNNHPPDVFTKLRDLLYTNEWTDSCDPAPCQRGLVGEKEAK